MKYLRSFYKRHRGMAALALLLLLGQVVGTLLIPALIANVVDLGILPGNMDAILRTGGQMLAVALLSAGGGGRPRGGAPLAHTSVLPEAKPWRKAEFSSALQMKSKGSRAKCALRGAHPHRRVPGALQGVSARTPWNRRTANRADEKAVVP